MEEVKSVIAKEYQKVFSDNYRGTSEQGKELIEFLKKRETSRVSVSYIPWAVLIRMATQQDPSFEIEKVRTPEGSFLFYNGRTKEDGIDDACYFVKVRVKFMGKEIIEEYPLQDKLFEPVSFVGGSITLCSGKQKELRMDANIINKALQRASAKALSIMTGLGLSLYETGDLQFEEEAESPGNAKVDKKTGEIKTAAPSVDPSLMIDDDQLKIIEILAKDEKTKARLDKALASYKAATYKDFTKAQATTVIKALSKPATPPVAKVEAESEKKE
jgi:hypothetical protein